MGEFMNLQEIKKNYDLIVSLGMSCAPSINLQRTGLRKFSMPLDWMISYSLNDVNRLYKNKFQNFMEFQNLHALPETHYFLEDGLPAISNGTDNTLVKAYYIRDSLYSIISVHDFPITPGIHWSANYSAFKAKLDLRIMRFWGRLMNSTQILFVRWFATYEQAVELHVILTNLLPPNTFTILILIPTPGLVAVREVNWYVNTMCVVEVPEDMNNYESWDYILSGITTTSSY